LAEKKLSVEQLTAKIPSFPGTIRSIRSMKKKGYL
jgi:hypothetical protein